MSGDTEVRGRREASDHPVWMNRSVPVAGGTCQIKSGLPIIDAAIINPCKDPLKENLAKSYFVEMCNRIRGLRDWNDIPRRIAGSRINFDYNPNVAPTETVPAFLVERGKGEETKLARFGINLKAAEGKRRPPLLNARTDSLRRPRHSRACSPIAAASFRRKASTNGARRTERSSRISLPARTASPSSSPESGTTRR